MTARRIAIRAGGVITVAILLGAGALYVAKAREPPHEAPRKPPREDRERIVSYVTSEGKRVAAIARVERRFTATFPRADQLAWFDATLVTAADEARVDCAQFASDAGWRGLVKVDWASGSHSAEVTIEGPDVDARPADRRIVWCALAAFERSGIDAYDDGPEHIERGFDIDPERAAGPRDGAK